MINFKLISILSPQIAPHLAWRKAGTIIENAVLRTSLAIGNIHLFMLFFPLLRFDSAASNLIFAIKRNLWSKWLQIAF